MNILLVAPTRIPARSANTIQVMKMAQAFTALGLQVEVVYPASPVTNGMEVVDWEFLAEHYGLQSRFPIVSLPVYPSARRYDYAWKAVRRARGKGVDLVYTRLLQAAAIASRTGVPAVLEVHDLPGGRTGMTLFRQFIGGRGRRRLVIISNALQKDLDRLSTLPQEANFVLVAPDGVDLSRYEGIPPPEIARQQISPALLIHGHSLDPRRFTAGYSGHLYSGRGVDMMLEMAVNLPNINFLLVGGEPQQVQEYRGQVSAIGLSNVVLTGFIPNADLPKYQAACDVLLMPYQEKVSASSGGDISRYLSPMKVFEYMACGRAILSSDLPVLREILTEQNAVLLPAGNLERWISALLDLHSSPQRLQALGTQARLDAQNYTWEGRAARILAALPGVPDFPGTALPTS